MSEVYVKPIREDYYIFPELNTNGSTTHTVSFTITTDLNKSSDRYYPTSIIIRELKSSRDHIGVKTDERGSVDRRIASIEREINTPESTFQLGVSGDEPLIYSWYKHIEISDFKITDSSGRVVFPQKVEDPLPRYKESAIATLKAYKSRYDYSLSLEQFDNIISSGEDKINNAANKRDVDQQLNIYREKLDNLKTDSEIEAENLYNYKVLKKTEIETYVSRSDYSTNLEQLDKAILDGKKSIDDAGSIQQVDEATAEAKVRIDNIKSDTDFQDTEVGSIRLIDSRGKIIKPEVSRSRSNSATFTIPKGFIAPIKLISENTLEKLVKLEKGDVASDWTPAIEDTEGKLEDKADYEELDEVRSEVSGLETVKADRAEVSNLEDSLIAYSEALSKNEEDLNEAKRDLVGLLERTAGMEVNYGEFTNVKNFLHTQIVEGEEGIFVGDRTDNSGIRIGPKGIFFMNGAGEPVASMTGGILRIDRGFFAETMTIGEHKFEYISKGNLIVRWDTTTVRNLGRG